MVHSPGLTDVSIASTPSTLTNSGHALSELHDKSLQIVWERENREDEKCTQTVQ